MPPPHPPKGCPGRQTQARYDAPVKKLTINGEEKQLSAADTADVAALLAALGMAGQPVAVEVNRKLVPRRDHADTPLHDGDIIEMVTLVGGG